MFAQEDEADVVMDDDNGPADLVGWENLNEHEKDIKIGDSLKHMGNVKRRKMSKLIMADMLGIDGAATLKDLKKNREKALAHENRKIDNIYLACRFFDKRMQTRREMMRLKTQQSIAGNYTTREYDWKNDYEEIMDQKRR